MIWGLVVAGALPLVLALILRSHPLLLFVLSGSATALLMAEGARVRVGFRLIGMVLGAYMFSIFVWWVTRP